MTHWRFAEATDTGLVRQSNQDAVYVDDSLAIVADGMGGHAAGEVASEMTIELLRSGFAGDQSVEGLYNAINAANISVLNDARENPNHFGMGTTVIAIGLTVDGEGVTSPTLCHVGDSRAYQLRDGALRLLTDDHSVAEEWVRMGRLTPEEAAVHPRRHQLTRGVGVEDTIAVDVMSVHALRGDRLLLCSDGLSNELDSDTLARLASAPFTLEESVTQLIEAAKEAGGHDNISAVLLEFDDINVASTPIQRTISSTTPPVAKSAAATTVRRRKKRGLTWRTPFVAAVLIGVVVGAYFIVHWYAYSTYYLGDDSGVVAIYQGQPGGVLWFKPTLVVDTSYNLNTLRPGDQSQLEQTISEPTFTAARKYSDYLCSVATKCTVSTQPSSTTTTTVPTTTTLKGG
ncbi:MAG TPA: PP2C family serine/threonine-protein phosphatase [Acidimicrobiales bacterium]